MTSKRYRASPEAIAALDHDGIGWGHDLDCGCLSLGAQAQHPGVLRRIATRLLGEI